MITQEPDSQGSAPAPPVLADGGRSEERMSLVRLLVGVVFILGVAAASGALAPVVVFGALLFFIMVHEAGHLVSARLAGMKVTEFFVGFGPRLWSVRRGETEYGVKAIPAGGYCRIIGMSSLEEVDPADEPRTYRQQSFPRRIAVAGAGPATHFFIAFALLWGLHTMVGVPDYTRLEVGEISRLETGQAPALEAGLEVGDRLVSVDGRPADDWAAVRSYIQGNPGRPIELRVDRDGRPVNLIVTPVDLATVDGDAVGTIAPDAAGRDAVGYIGVRPEYPTVTASPVAGVGRAAGDTFSYAKLVVTALGEMFSPGGMAGYADTVLSPPGSADPASGEADNRFLSPVGFVRVASQASDQGLVPVFMLLIAVNLFVGILNLVPLLPLDGGHIAVATYERIRSRGGRRYRVDAAKLLPVTYVVVMVLLFIGLSSLYLDIFRPLGNMYE